MNVRTAVLAGPRPCAVGARWQPGIVTRWLVFLLLALRCAAQPLPGTAPLTLDGDPALRMVEGIRGWLEREAPRTIAHRPPTVERLRYIVGAVDARVPFDDLEVIASLSTPPLRTGGAGFSVRAVRWPVFEGVHGEGLLLEPTGAVRGHVVVIPDAGTPPEASREAQRLAGLGYEVLAMALIDRDDRWSGNPAFRMTNQPHREFIYRMAFPVGRHIIGYEVEKVLAAVDWFARAKDGKPIGVSGEGEGGLIAFYTGALDERIAVTEVRGYFGPRQGLAAEPIYRNVWGLLRDFGDAEVATLYRGRRLVVAPGGPRVEGPPPERAGRRGAAPGRLEPVSAAPVAAEAARARQLGATVEERRGSAFGEAGEPLRPLEIAAPPDRMRRQVAELVDYTQRLVRASARERDRYWAAADHTSPARWLQTSAPYRARVLDDQIGRLPAPTVPANPRTRLAYRGAGWDGYEVTLDLFPSVFAYGVLLVPRGVRAGERLPVVVGQHGLQGRPQELFAQPASGKPGDAFRYYQNIGDTLVARGFAVYLPQNPYTGDFRPLVRLGNPWGLTIYSFILAQHERTLEWLASLSFVDGQRIGFYGLSYGGKTALHIPPLLDRYAVSVCSGDFNEWIYKLSTVDEPFSYLFSNEYEMPEWNQGGIASHAELASLMAPRPFMVERGHNDGVGTDEWVAHEYARVQRLYDQMGIGERTRIEYFNGPHQMHAVGTIEFLTKWLQPERR
jgi:dienelactone hydrolase